MLKPFLILFLTITTTTQKNFPNLCLKTTKTNKCEKCSKTYKTSSGLCKKPKHRIPNCISYLTPKKCSSCDKGYYLEKDKCSKILIKNCAAGKLNECFICEKGLKLDRRGNCVDKCEKTNCDFCSVFGSVEFCVECRNGFSLNEFMYCVIEPFKGCNIVRAGKCDVCRIGFFMKNGKCFENTVSVKKIRGVRKGEEIDFVKVFRNLLSSLEVLRCLQYLLVFIFYI